jgi:hypothetical protein
MGSNRNVVDAQLSGDGLTRVYLVETEIKN